LTHTLSTSEQGRAAEAQSGMRLDSEHDLPTACPPAPAACVPVREADAPLSLGARLSVPSLFGTADKKNSRFEGLPMIRLRVQEVRRECGKSQEWLAKKLGMKQPALSRLERRAVPRRLDVRLLEKIARELDVPLKRLLVIE
jgi:DNA-binding XRE family transcriptional regulator